MNLACANNASIRGAHGAGLGAILSCLISLTIPSESGAEALSFGISTRYDHALTSGDDSSSSGLVSTNQVLLSARTPVGGGHAYAMVNTRVGRGYTEIGSRGAEFGFDHGSWFVGFGQSMGTEFSWITATAVTGNVGNLSLLSAFPKRSLVLGVRANPSDSFRVISHDGDGTRPNPGRGMEWSWVRKTDAYTVRLADYRQSSLPTGLAEPRQTGVSIDTTRGGWTTNLRWTDLRSVNGEGLRQVGAGARLAAAPTVNVVADAMVSKSDGQDRDFKLFSAGAFWAFHSQADAYLLGYRIQNDARALRLVGPVEGRLAGDDPSGIAVGVRVRIALAL